MLFTNGTRGSVSGMTTSSRPRPKAAVVPREIADDASYVTWIEDNPGGFVANVTATLSPGYFVLHAATCPTIHPARCGQVYDPGAFTERGYRKFVALSARELLAWADAEPFTTVREGCGCLRGQPRR